MADVVAILDALADQGVVALLKADGEREHNKWTFAAIGSAMGENTFRIDASAVDACLDKAVPRLRELGLTVPA